MQENGKGEYKIKFLLSYVTICVVVTEFSNVKVYLGLIQKNKHLIFILLKQFINLFILFINQSSWIFSDTCHNFVNYDIVPK